MTIEEARADLMLAQADISYRPKDDSIDLAIIALENQKSIIEELEKIICELRDYYTSMPIFNKREWREENKAYLDCESIIFKHISELKGE